MSQAPVCIVLQYPLPERITCPRCWGHEDPTLRTRGTFCDPAHLNKHLKKYHPGDTVSYECSQCSYQGVTRYPLKDVTKHFEKLHSRRPTAPDTASPRTTTASAASTAASSSRRTGATVSTRSSASVARAGTAGVRTRASPANPSPISTGESRVTRAAAKGGSAPSTRAVTSRITTATVTRSTARPSAAVTRTVRRSPAAVQPPRPSTSASSSAVAYIASSSEEDPRPLSPSYAAVTVAPVSRRTAPSSPSIAGARGAAILSGSSSAGRLALRRVPACCAAVPSTAPAATYAPANQAAGCAAANRSGATSPPVAPAAAHAPANQAAGAVAANSREAPLVLNRSRNSATRVAALADFFESPPDARPSRVSPLPPRVPPGSGDRGSVTQERRSPPPTTSAVHTPPRVVMSAEGAWGTGSARASSSPGGGSAGAVSRTSPRTLPQRTSPTTCGVPLGSSATPPAFSPPVSTSAATITTCTVVTTVVGSPIMSTGLPRPAGRWVSPPAGTPPAIGSPRVPVSAPVGRTGPRGATTSPPTPRRVLRPRNKAPPVIPPSSGSEGDDDGASRGDDSWTVALSRSARRKARRVTSGSSSEESNLFSETEERATPGPPPVTSANYPPLPSGGYHYSPRTSGGAATGTSGGGTPPDAVLEVAAGQRAVNVSAEHPIAPVSVRGVMGRRGARASVRGRAGAAGATAAHANVASGAVRQPASRRNPAAASGRPGEVTAGGASVERRSPLQRALERDRLVALAESVETPADLDVLAAQVAKFVGECGQGGRAARPRDRSGRSREAGNSEVRARDEGARDGAVALRPAPAGPRGILNGEGARDRGREAARIQALFRKNRRKAIREVLAGPAEVCDLPTDVIQRHFEEIYSGVGSLHSSEHVEPPEASSSEDDEAACLVDPFTEREVDRRLRRMNNSAPGPDGHTYRDLRAADPRGRLLAAVFNTCLRLKVIPSSWKTSNTVLVYKKGDRGRLENWRPLALGDTMPKLFAAVLADRMTDWAIANGKLSPAQKGFLRDEGCYEHNFVLQEILTDARRSRREAVVAWLDLSNAFGSVPHASIRRALVSAGVPASLIEIWGSMYDGCTTRVRTADGYTAPIVIRSGVRQGCPLSPIVFDLVIDSVLRAVTELGPSLELLGSRWSVMAYADDLVLVSRSPDDMRRLLAAAESEAASVGLRFNPAKCATLHVGGGVGGRVLPTPFVIQGQTVTSMADGEAYEHLGIPTGFSVSQTPHNTLGALSEDLQAVDRSLLAPWQKAEAVATFLLPRLDFLLRGANVEKRFLKAVDLHVRKVAKSWMNLPQRASAEVVYIPPSRGGCGLLPMADLVDVLTIAHVFRLLTADDRAVRDLAWASLRGVVHRRVGHPPSCDEVAAFLSGSLEGNLRGGGETSLWSRARNAARRQSERCVIRWSWIEELQELVLECRGSRGRTVKIPPGARAQVIGRLRSSVAEYYSFTLLVKPDQGKVFEVSSRARVSNHFLRSGGFTRFADWRFIHRARLDVLPLNGARRWGEGDKRCRRCGADSETLPHVLCHCGPHSAAIQWRHDSVLLRLRRACRLPGNVTVNQRVEGIDGELGTLRPDLVIRHEPSKSVVICDVTVPFENRWAAFEEARERKVAKYSPLAEELRRLGYRVVVTAFVVGALGSWDPANETTLRQLGVSRSYASMMRRLMVSDTIRWSRDIYVEHVSGARQYVAPPRRADGGCPDVAVPRAVRRRVTSARPDDAAANVS